MLRAYPILFYLGMLIILQKYVLGLTEKEAVKNGKNKSRADTAERKNIQLCI